jgi:hypothetical protein
MPHCSSPENAGYCFLYETKRKDFCFGYSASALARGDATRNCQDFTILGMHHQMIARNLGLRLLILRLRGAMAVYRARTTRGLMALDWLRHSTLPIDFQSFFPFYFILATRILPETQRRPSARTNGRARHCRPLSFISLRSSPLSSCTSLLPFLFSSSHFSSLPPFFPPR